MSAVAELPKVDGQHRNKALAASRRVKAVELRTRGLTYDQIAVQLGYANRGTVFRVVSDALKAETVEAVKDLRSLEVARLDALQDAVWDKAMAGDVPSVMAARRVIMARCRLLGLDGPGTERPGKRVVDIRSRTVVIPQET
jgi:hypothetical protein